MLITIDGRRIRANGHIRYSLAGITADGRHVFLDEHDDRTGRVCAGPTVTAAEWLHHGGSPWVPCPGGGRAPSRIVDTSNAMGTFYFGAGVCSVCGARQNLTHNARQVWKHKRPPGQHFDADGVQAINDGKEFR